MPRTIQAPIQPGLIANSHGLNKRFDGQDKIIIDILKGVDHLRDEGQQTREQLTERGHKIDRLGPRWT